LKRKTIKIFKKIKMQKTSWSNRGQRDFTPGRKNHGLTVLQVAFSASGHNRDGDLPRAKKMTR